ncbi:MAG TPA: GTPase Era [Elusimicrobia bacterium]|nr:MAG: GTPase Era [Elusimicrobia bacterium GWA2_66_18]OGR73007.1 MAG: GTPase Era [Elusimicrobia bacterium GWC2_65_9]HAZ08158.1 GTPase Era [Elusimicrobiota bacterium]
MESAHKAGFVALAGLPNVGKSTLLNSLLKFKLSIVSHKPQTTRHRVLGILEGPGFQACFLDTPGLIEKPADPLQKALRVEASRAIREDADLVVYLVDVAEADPGDVIHSPLRSGVPVLLALNKCDRVVSEARVAALEAAYSAALKPDQVLRISALKGAGVDELKAEILARLPENPPFYEKGRLSDRWERFFAAEIVREQVFALYHDEIPHATAVVVETFREHHQKKGRPDEVFATLYVERDGQKGIIIGKSGKDLRSLTERAQAALENFLGRPVILELWIKVRKDWRKDQRSLEEFGYRT